MTLSTNIEETERSAGADEPQGEPVPAGSQPRPDHPFILGGRAFRWSSSSGWSPWGALGIAVVAAFALLPVRGLYRTPGGTMEEGFMLYFPELVRNGKVPNVDFLHLYGPGGLHLLAGWYEIFGDTLAASRSFGLLQNLGIIFGLYAIGRVWGRGVAAGTGVVAVMIIMVPIGIQAMAWHGALALGLWTVVFMMRARHLEGRQAVIAWAVAGFLGGLALSMRPDMIIAVLLVVLVAVWRDRVTAWKPVLGGGLVGLIPMWVHLIMAGPRASFEGMVIDPIFNLRPGRELPAPPSWDQIDGSLLRVVEAFPPTWDLPAMAASKQLYFWFWTMVIAAIAIPAWAWWRRRRGDHSDRALVLLVAGLFGLGILGQGLQRPDSTHLAWVTIASWPLLVPVVADVAPRLIRRLRAGGGATIAFAAVAVLLFVICPFYTYRYYALYTRIAFGDLPAGFQVERDGREFYFGDFGAATALQEAVDDLDRWSEPGERLIVGPAELSRTYYNEAIVYWMFPDLEPGTYYIEMDPGMADAEDSGLAEEVAETDWIMLSRLWERWDEPNESVEFRSDEPNQVMAEQFCLVGAYGSTGGDPFLDGADAAPLFTLYQRCGPDDAMGISPAEVDGTTPVVDVVAR